MRKERFPYGTFSPGLGASVPEIKTTRPLTIPPAKESQKVDPLDRQVELIGFCAELGLCDAEVGTSFTFNRFALRHGGIR